MATAYSDEILSPAESDTKEFVELAKSNLGWGNLSKEEMVMDIGCGSGKSCRIIVNMLPNIKKLVGIDSSSSQIQYAEANNTHKNIIKFYIADIQTRSSLVEWEGKVSSIFSIFCFNWLDNQITGFQNIYHLLKPGGGAAVLLTINSPYYNCTKQLLKNFKWRSYKPMLRVFPDSKENKLDFLEYRNILENLGFEIVLCKKVNKVFEYPSEKSFKENTVEKLPLLPLVPQFQREEFKKNYFELFAEQNGKTIDGKPLIKYQLISILIRKNQFPIKISVIKSVNPIKISVSRLKLHISRRIKIKGYDLYIFGCLV